MKDFLSSRRAKCGHPEIVFGEKQPLDHHVAIAPRDDESFLGLLRDH